MDSARFDRLARTLAAAGTRRTLIQLLTTVPLAGALAFLEEDVEGRGSGAGIGGGGGRRRRRKRRQHRESRQRRRDRRRKAKRKGKNADPSLPPPPPDCIPLTACAAPRNCGTIDNGCGTGLLTCGGPCGGRTPICVNNVCTACSAANPCPECQICNDNGECVADATNERTCCGPANSGMRCQAGACAAATATLAECQGRCDGGSVDICGRAAACPSCSACSHPGCFVEPCFGVSYCVSRVNDLQCDEGSPCFGSDVCCSPFCLTICA